LGFEELGRRIGLAVEIPDGQTYPSLTIDLKDVPPLEALDRLARAAGVMWQPHHGDGAGLRGRRAPPAPGALPRIQIYFQKPPLYPAAWVRHYRIQVSQVTLTRTQNFQQPQSHASLSLGLAWLPSTIPDSVAELRVLEILDDRGRSLMPEAVRRPGNPRFYRSRHLHANQHTENVMIKYPESDAASISVLKGSAKLEFPSATELLKFSPAAAGIDETRKLEGYSIRLHGLNAAEKELRLTVEIAGPDDAGTGEQLPFSYEDVAVLLENGERLQNQGMSGSSGQGTYTWELRFRKENDSPVKEIQISCVLKRHVDEFPFEIQDIPLPR
jgi:hypothetical protein